MNTEKRGVMEEYSYCEKCGGRVKGKLETCRWKRKINFPNPASYLHPDEPSVIEEKIKVCMPCYYAIIGLR